jgi:hypothetical protein
MRRTLSLTSELGSDDYAGRYVDVMADNALRVDDYTSEMRQIKAFADLGIVRNLEMILAAQSVEPVIVNGELDLCYLSADTVIFLDLVIIVTGTAHDTDITELRAGSSLLQIAGIDVLVTPGIAGVPEQVRIYDVLEFICHSVSVPSLGKILYLFDK